MLRRSLLSLALVSALAGAQTPVLTHHNDNLRTGANLTEKTLTTANVAPGRFGKLFTRKVDGQLYAQPLYLPGLTVGGRVRDVVFAATMHDTVYAFDAKDPAAEAPLWKRSWVDEANGITTIPYQNLVGWTDIEPEIGILSTPVIDPATNTMYVVVRTLEGDPNDDASYKQRLYALDVRTGQDKTPPVLLSGTFPGNGDQSNGAGLNVYNGRRQNQRPALTLANGRIYIASASHGDTRPYHGWVLAYDAGTLAYRGAYNSTPNGGLGGFWMSGQGPAVDEAGNLYLVTGNGPYDPVNGNFGDSIVKLSPDLAILDWFTPFNQKNLEDWDADLGSTGILLIPGTNLGLIGSKEGKVYVFDRANLGKFNAGADDHARQWWWAAGGHIHGSPVFYDGPDGRRIYLWSEMDRIKAFGLGQNDLFDFAPKATGTVVAPDGMPGAFLSVSADGKTAGTGIVWANLPLEGNANQQTVPGVLRAFDASTLRELWNSRLQLADDLGKFAKYAPPTVADGRVYVGTFSGELAVYGLLPAIPPQRPSGLTATPGERRVVLNWNSAPRASTYEVLRAPTGGRAALLVRGVAALTYADRTATPGVRYDYWVRGRNAFGQSAVVGPVTAAALESTTVQSFAPNGDAFVMKGVANNYGAASTLVLDGNSTSRTRYAYVKFDLANLARGAVLQAKLRLTGSRVGDTISRDSVYEVATDFDERTITWDNKPAFQGILDTVSVSKERKAYEWDVTALLKRLQSQGVKTVRFGLAMEPRPKEEPPFSDGKRVADTFSSREARSDRPELVVTTRPVIDFSNGFASAGIMAYNGSAKRVGPVIRLCDLQNWQAGSVFHRTRMQVERFRTKFRFQLKDPGADGIAFVMQNNGPYALGANGGGLAYQGLGKSVAIKFDIWDNAGEGWSSSGLFVNGAMPTVPATDLGASGVDLRSGRPFDVEIAYDGSILQVRITDAENGATAVQRYNVDLVDVLGGTIAHVGFTGATGGANGRFELVNWFYGL